MRLIEVYTKVALINMLISYAQSSPPHLPQNLNSNKSFQAKQKIRSIVGGLAMDCSQYGFQWQSGEGPELELTR